jgi:histidyl-tRNA synthetase
LDKIGPDGVATMLSNDLELTPSIIEKVLTLATIKGSGNSVIDQIRSLNVRSGILEEGINELEFVMQQLEKYKTDTFLVDLSIARGLAYYTGTVYESRFTEYPDFPTICGGGRYDNLVGDFVNKKLPGIGISIGLTRIFSKLMHEGKIQANRKTPTDILVVHTQGAPYDLIKDTANILRARGFNVEQYHEDRKLKAQLKYAGEKMIPWIWFPPTNMNGIHEVKNSVTRVQTISDPKIWLPE